MRKCGVVHSWAGWTYSCLKAMAAHSSPIGVLHGGGISLNISTNSWSIFDPISGINSGVPNLRKSIAHCSPGGRIKSGNLRYIALRELATGGIGWDGPRMHQAGPNMAVKWLTLRYPYCGDHWWPQSPQTFSRNYKVKDCTSAFFCKRTWAINHPENPQSIVFALKNILCEWWPALPVLNMCRVTKP